jgi:putative exosortase-associated protein (TIGR04073 family)
MRKNLSLLAAVVVGGALIAGCAGPEQKLGRGIRNTCEIVRWSSMERSIEQSSLFDGTEKGQTDGVVTGFGQTIARTGMGIIDVVTFPIPYPSYKAWGTNIVPADVQWPDSYKPGSRGAQALATDDNLGFAGGTIMPWVPGNRFRIFDYNW